MLGSVQHELGDGLGEAPLACIFVRSDDARHRTLEYRCRKRSPQRLTRRRAGMQTGRRVGYRKGAIARAFRAEHIAEWRAAARAGMHRIDRSYACDAIVAYESTGTLASGTARRRDDLEGDLAHALPPCRHGRLAVRIFHGQHPLASNAL